VNTTARIESLSEKNKIHISESTASRLIAAGKEHWVKLREDTVVAKGKGAIKTYWLNLGVTSTGSIARGSEKDDTVSDVGSGDVGKLGSIANKSNSRKQSDGFKRIVEWNVDLLQRQLKIIIAHRQAKGTKPDSPEDIHSLEMTLTNPHNGPLEEVQDVIMLPKYDGKKDVSAIDANSIEIDDVALSQLQDYVQTIANMYNDNPFHNYAHARYVVLAWQ
jgi:hypothetical protein